MFFLETVGRHGARSLTSDSIERDVLQIWERAYKQAGSPSSARAWPVT